MNRALFVLALVAAASGCGRFSDNHGGRPAPGARGPAMVGYTNPAGLKVPDHAVSAKPSAGFWNCEGNRPEHAARCTLYPDAPRAVVRVYER